MALATAKLFVQEGAYDMVKREKGKIDILFASAGQGELAKLEEVTEEHFGRLRPNAHLVSA